MATEILFGNIHEDAVSLRVHPLNLLQELCADSLSLVRRGDGDPRDLDRSLLPLVGQVSNDLIPTRVNGGHKGIDMGVAVVSDEVRGAIGAIEDVTLDGRHAMVVIGPSIPEMDLEGRAHNSSS